MLRKTKLKFKKCTALLTLLLSTLSLAMPVHATAILFQDDSFATVESDTLLLGSNDAGTNTTGVQFGNDTASNQNGNITYSLPDRNFLVDHSMFITNPSLTEDTFRANNAADALTPFVITNDGDVGIGTTDLGYPDMPTRMNVLAESGQNSVITASGDINDFLQTNIHNSNSGVNASSDVIATNDTGDNTTNYVDMGINSSGYANPDYTITGPNDSYLYSNGGNLALGTQTVGQSLVMHTGGTLAENERMRIDGDGNVGINTTTPGAKLDLSGEMHFSGSTSGYVGLVAPAVAGSTTYTLPGADGPNGDVLTTDGSGGLTWTDRFGKFQRVGTTLSPNVAGDDITTSGAIYTTGTGAMTSAGLLTGSAGLSITGGAVNLNVSSNNNTNINTGTSTGTVNVGNSTSGNINLQSANSTVTIDGSNLNLQPGGTSTTGKVQIGAGGAGSSTPDLLMVDVKSLASGAGDPSGGADGAMYYNAFLSAFRCYIGGVWLTCANASGLESLQDAYNVDGNVVTGSSSPIHFDLASGDFNVDGTGAVNLTPTAASQFTSGGALTFTGGASSAWGTSAGDLRLYATGTSAGKVQVGTGSATATPDILVLDQGSVEPTGTNGSMYYDTVLDTFRCYEAGGWQDCGQTAASSTTLQQAYVAGNDISTTGSDVAITLNGTDQLTATGAGAVNLTPTGASSFTSGGALTLTAGAASTWGTTAGDLKLQAAGTGSANVQIGTGGAGSTTPDLLGVDVKTSAGDPTGYDGAIYYNTTAHSGDGRFRCYESGAWKDCDAGVVASYQTAYNNGGTVTTSSGNPISFTLASGDFNVIGGITTLDTTVNMPGLTPSKLVFTDASDNLSSTGTVPISQGGTGQTTKAAAFDALSPNTTKGDLIGFSTTNVRFPVGSNGQVLSADSTQVAGLKWVTPSAGSVTSVAASGGTTGLSFSGGPITTSGTLTLAGTLTTANGGTGDTTLTNHGVLVGAGTGPVNQLAAAVAGTVLTGQGTGADPSFLSTPTLGIAGTTLGTLALAGNTSGTVTIKPQAAAGTYNFNLPTTAGTSGQPLLSGGGVASPMTFGTLSIGAGGTGQTTATTAFNALSPLTTKGDVLTFDGTNNIRVPAGANGQVLSADSTQTSGLKWITALGLGTVTSVDGSGGTTGLTLTGGPITTVGTLTIGGTLGIANGGTNSTATATAGGVGYGTGTAHAYTGAGLTGQVLQSAGAGTPTWSTPTYPSASGAAGKILRSAGTNNVYSTATFADTYTASNLLYSNGANTVQGLATANNGILVTSATGVPSITSSLDFSNATSFTLPKASTDPATCTIGQQFYNTTTNTVRVCTATNTWSSTGGSGTNFVSAYDTTTQSVSSVGTFQDVTFSNNASLSNWTHTAGAAPFTAAVNGTFMAHITAEVAKAGGANTDLSLRAVKNGTEIPGSQSDCSAAAATANTCAANFLIDLASGDIIKVQLTGGTTGAQVLPGGFGTTKPSVTLLMWRLG